MRRTAFALGLIVLFSTATIAQEGQRLSAGAVQAAKEFTGIIGKSAATKTRPDLTVPPAAPLFAKIFDTKALASLPAPTASDLPWSSEWLGASASSYMAMLNFGTNPQAPDYQQAVEDNVQHYEDEISNAMNFMLRLMPRMSVAARAFLQSLTEAERNQPTRQQGMKNVRDGYLRTVSGAASFVAGGPKTPNARLVSRALSDTVDEWRMLASAEERSQLADLVNEARKEVKDREAEESLAAVASALAATK